MRSVPCVEKLMTHCAVSVCAVSVCATCVDVHVCAGGGGGGGCGSHVALDIYLSPAIH